MIKIEREEVYGWGAAVRGMRNPMNSWKKSDSVGDMIGQNDLSLMGKLIKSGTDHSKFMRYIDVALDITAPLYWWKEFETYRVGVFPYPSDIEMNSCSTMHKIHAKEFDIKDFSHDQLIHSGKCALRDMVDILNGYRDLYLDTKDKVYWWQMIQLLPSSYNQRRTVHLNYAALRNMYFARRNHKLTEWRDFCLWIETLPYSESTITLEG